MSDAAEGAAKGRQAACVTVSPSTVSFPAFERLSPPILRVSSKICQAFFYGPPRRGKGSVLPWGLVIEAFAAGFFFFTRRSVAWRSGEGPISDTEDIIEGIERSLGGISVHGTRRGGPPVTVASQVKSGAGPGRPKTVVSSALNVVGHIKGRTAACSVGYTIDRASYRRVSLPLAI